MPSPTLSNFSVETQHALVRLEVECSTTVDKPVATEILENNAYTRVKGEKRFLRVEHLGRGRYAVTHGPEDGRPRTFLVKP